MSDIALLWLLFIVGYLINENIFVLQLTVFSPLRGTMDWIGLDVGRNTHGHRGLDWIGSVS